ncbi:iron permease FTR1/Fip1/EfeU [Lipomyces starkeyi]
MIQDIFNVSIFFIVFRETLEASVVVSVLLAFIKQGVGKSAEDPTVYKKLVRHIWVGVGLGFLICLVIGGAFIGTWYTLGTDIWGASEDLWEGILSIVAAIIISIMGLALLRLNKMKEKWRVKIAKALEQSNIRGKGRFRHFMRKYAMAILPFITVLREGVEAIVFRGDIMKIQYFLIVATCFLYLVASGLFSNGVWSFQNHEWVKLVGGDVSEEGDGPGSYDIRKNLWHVNCCNGETSGGWMIFNAILGWENSATYGSVISYNLYWLTLMMTIGLMLFKERHGHYPFLKFWTKKRNAAPLAQEEQKSPENEIQQFGSSDGSRETKEAVVSVV